jgi:M6 family metalloprotease-like protein
MTDFEGGITYACLKDGRFASTGVSITEPPPQGLPRHLQEDPTRRHELFVKNFGNIRKVDLTAPPPFTFGPANGLLKGRKRSVGNVRGLTVIVEFSDQSTSITRAQVDDLLNKEGYSQGGHLGSVRDYYKTMSNDKLDYRNDVIGPIRLPNTRSYYSEKLLFDDAINAAIQQEGLDLRDYATRQQGESSPVVDAINFLYAGGSVYKKSLWPHNGMCVRNFNGVKTGLYMLTGLGERTSSMSIGTICHETGHLLCRFPDLYDYGTRDEDSERSGGIGTYCLMGSGNHLGSGRVPASICGYLRKLAGWVDNVVEMESGRQYDLRHGDYGTVYLHRTSTKDEYFIVENRSRHGYDKYLSSNGLSVLHCDIYGSNEWQGGTADRHYQCALLQADGKGDLEQDRNRGDANDMFKPRNGVFFSADTRPHSREWSGADSGLILRDLKSRDTVMTVRTGMPSVSENAVAESWPRVEIPDNDSGGVSVTLELPPKSPANSIKVSVKILHSWRGDLTVDLISPSGKTARLRNDVGGWIDNLMETWSSDSHTALAGLTGTSGAGIWTIKVVDTSSNDVGTLEYVRISCS